MNELSTEHSTSYVDEKKEEKREGRLLLPLSTPQQRLRGHDLCSLVS